MNESIWPIKIGDQTFNEPHITGSKCSINNKDFIKLIEKNPMLWCHLMKHKNSLSEQFIQYINNISSKFEPDIPKGSLARVKVPGTDWQSSENHRYVKIEMVHCENYDLYLLPFHDAEHQYCGFFINIELSVQNDTMTLFWDEDQKTDGSYEEHVWLSKENMEILYLSSPNHNIHQRIIGEKDTYLKFMKQLCNMHVNELLESSTDALSIFVLRLRGKCRCGTFGTIISVSGILSDSQRFNIEEMLSEITERDTTFEKKSSGDITSYKLTRSQLFGALKINAGYLTRIFDPYGKEMKIHRTISTFPFFDENSEGYTRSLKVLLANTCNKFEKKRRIINELCGMNGLRATFNNRTNGFKLTTNTFYTKIDFENINIKKQSFPIKEELGRKHRW